MKVEGYDDSTYGEAFADVYDEWYAGVSDVAATVAKLAELAGSGDVLELAVGTGRLALPLARAVEGRVIGIDVSTAMIERLRMNAAAEGGVDVDVVVGDMVEDMPRGPFRLIFVAYNSLFNLRDPERVRACFANAASRLDDGGAFVVEAFVPDPEARPTSSVTVRSLSADRVVLSATVTDAEHQTAHGQFIEITEAHGVRLRPWSIRYCTIAELDRWAAEAGLTAASRWASFEDQDSPPQDRHVTVYRRQGHT